MAHPASASAGAKLPIRWLRWGRMASVAAATILLCSVWAAEQPAAVGGEPFAQLPLRRDADESGSSWGPLAFVGVLGALAIVASVFLRKGRRAGAPAKWGLRAWTTKGQESRISIIERHDLNSACTLFLVRLDDEELLVGCTSHAVSVMTVRKSGLSGKAN
jgi:hypothetical protein